MARTPEQEARYLELKEQLTRMGAVEDKEGRMRSPYEEKDTTLLEEAMNIPKGLAAGVANIPKAAYSTITQTPYEPYKWGEGPVYEASEFVGNIAPYFIPGPHQATVPARLATSVISNLLTSPGEEMKGAKEGLMFGLAAESIPYVGKAVEKIGGKFTRADLVDNISEKISKMFKKEKKEAYGIVKPVFDEYGNKRISNKATEYLADQTKDIVQYLGGGRAAEKQLYKDVLQKESGTPTLKELQDLQSDIGKVARKLDPEKSAATRAEIGKLDDAVEKIRDIIRSNFDYYQPGASKIYDDFLKAYAVGPGKYEFSPTMSKLAHKETEGISPQRLKSELAKGYQGDRPILPEGHALRGVGEDVKSKLQRSEIYNTALGGLAGLAAGGPWGGLGGLAAPKLLSMFGPGAGASFQKALIDQLEKVQPQLRRGIVGVGARPQEMNDEEEY